MKTKRFSNLELLRILAMLMIICSHIYCHCIADQLNGTWHSELYCNPTFYKSLGILALMSPTGKLLKLLRPLAFRKDPVYCPDKWPL